MWEKISKRERKAKAVPRGKNKWRRSLKNMPKRLKLIKYETDETLERNWRRTLKWHWAVSSSHCVETVLIIWKCVKISVSYFPEKLFFVKRENQWFVFHANFSQVQEEQRNINGTLERLEQSKVKCKHVAQKDTTRNLNIYNAEARSSSVKKLCLRFFSLVIHCSQRSELKGGLEALSNSETLTKPF